MCPIATIASIFYLLHIYSDYFSGYSRAKWCSNCQVFQTSDSLPSDIFRLNPKALTTLDITLKNILCAAVQGLAKQQIWGVGSMPRQFTTVYLITRTALGGRRGGKKRLHGSHASQSFGSFWFMFGLRESVNK